MWRPVAGMRLGDGGECSNANRSTEEGEQVRIEARRRATHIQEVEERVSSPIKIGTKDSQADIQQTPSCTGSRVKKWKKIT